MDIKDSCENIRTAIQSAFIRLRSQRGPPGRCPRINRPDEIRLAFGILLGLVSELIR
jgi:hypothetical protein